MMAHTDDTSHDPRIYVDGAQLCHLGPASWALSLLPRQPARSILNGRHASQLRGRGRRYPGDCDQRRLAQAGDLILFHVADVAGTAALPDNLAMTVSDENMQVELDTSDSTTRARLDAAIGGRLNDLMAWSRKYAFPVVPLGRETPALAQVMRLFGHQGAAR